MAFLAWINPWHWRWNRTTDVYDRITFFNCFAY